MTLVGRTVTRAPAALEHALGVVAGRGRLDDGRLAVGVQPGEQHGRLHLRARDRERVVDRRERAPVDPRAAGGRRSSRRCAPIRPSGSAIRSIGRARERLVARRARSVSPAWPARIPAISRTSVPALRAVDRASPGDARPREALARRRGACPRRARTTSTPSARTAAIVASVSAERPKPVIRVSPSQIAPIRTARCEIDLSPGTARCPTSRGTGSTTSESSAALMPTSPIRQGGSRHLDKKSVSDTVVAYRDRSSGRRRIVEPILVADSSRIDSCCIGDRSCASWSTPSLVDHRRRDDAVALLLEQLARRARASPSPATSIVSVPPRSADT